MSDEILLEVKNLTTEFHSETEHNTAVSGVSFSVRRGETIGIVGESGSGKSVTALSIMQLIPAPPGKITSGQILYTHKEKGKIDLLALEEKEMRRYRGNDISMIFQEPMTSLNPVFTCGNQVAEAIMLHQDIGYRAAKEKTLQLFLEVDLREPMQVFKSYPHEISGGQKQRVMIAMAMSCQPSLLIADEPTTALDVTVQKTILDLMKDLQDEHQMGIMFITHDLGVVAELADRVLVMYNGKIVEQGLVKDVFQNPMHPYTKGLLACRPPLDRKLSALPTISDFMDLSSFGELMENPVSVDEILKRLEVTDDALSKWHSELFSREPILEVNNLSTHFKGKGNFLSRGGKVIRAVDGVSFKVYKGETLGLVGESGCGKTTLGRTILQLIRSDSGEVLFQGQDVAKLSRKELRKLRQDIQIIFQDPYSSLNPRMTIGEAVMEPMRVHGILENDRQRKERVLELLQKVNMNPVHFDRYPHEFSGGQRQRICIARALALNPKFIICDESVSALDVSVQAQVLNLLNELKEEFQFTYIFISHDLSVVKFMSDRIIVMKDGKIEERGTAQEIYLHPQSEYTQKLIDSIPTGKGRKKFGNGKKTIAPSD